ncbi:hypothetical protein KP509_01G003000 [Ceratopteris richardii]|uniref:Exostosin GT47 domain-containing protein n=1 Tax=Ceratopteris richardii TaxID=49495 RepID=A0A8T2VHM3_CERRI|nr:hypothetical protein KP509_01G003000 [Ceratopteris richardii]KAH7445336.1 hypothetical protein KP509_01G003000 [Ceratopteris richardii]
MTGKLRWKGFLWLAIFIPISVLLFLLGTRDFSLSVSRHLDFFQDTFQGSRFISVQEFSHMNGPPLESLERCESPLRIYMYDLPRKFNLGMVKKVADQEKPWGKERVPSWPLRSGLKRQHSVEYWMMLSLLNPVAGNSSDSVAVRVHNPLEADLFFVPFFSSLSFNTHGVNMLDPETEKDRLLQVDVVEFLKKSPWYQRSGGRDHVLVVHHPNAFRFMRELLNTSIFIVADFGRFPHDVAWLGKDIVAPYYHMVEKYENDNVTDPFRARTTLLFFRGQTRRKDEGKIRLKFASLLQNQSMVVYEESSAKDGVQLSTEGMRLSRFCLSPAGDTPSSCRLFDAIVSHCVPVIVSDKIELPFEDELNYQEFCLFFSVEEALRPGYLLGILKTFPRRRWIKMWQKLKLVSHHFEYQYPVQKDDAVNMIWKQARRKLPTVRLAIHRSKRLKIPDWWHW